MNYLLKGLKQSGVALKSLLLAVVLIIGIGAYAQEPNIFPEPNSMRVGIEWITLSNDIVTSFKGFDDDKHLISQVKDAFKKVENTSADVLQVKFIRDKKVDNTQGYTLSIGKKGIVIKASTEVGLFYGVQTLVQYLDSYPKLSTEHRVKEVSIEDAPRFGYRSLMLDPARHFIPVEDVERYIDAMSFYKFNTLHFHLTDDHGWRIEIKKYPRLTEVGSKRDATHDDGILKGGFYTQEQLKDLVAYANERHVDLLPEIDIPGHGHALLTAYPEYACFPDTTLTAEIHEAYPHAEPICIGNPKFYEFYETIIQEMSTIFTCKEIHVGGDEVNKDAWSKCPKCQQLKSKEGLKKDDELMDHLFAEITKIAAKYDKKIIFWHEGGHHYPAGETVSLWRLGTAKEVIADCKKQNLQLICVPGEHAYFDYPQSMSDKEYLPAWIPVLTLKKTYEFDPGYGLSKEDGKFIRGVEATMWGESMKNMDRIFYMTYPRAFALADAGWTEMNNRSWEKFKEKLPHHLIILMKKGINFRPPIEL
ncbi:beta-hexosaminidase [Puteibacter caeruleilacunae]|nr:beta-hexosaminidase [Puteibacter caeruleilacunae]